MKRQEYALKRIDDPFQYGIIAENLGSLHQRPRQGDRQPYERFVETISKNVHITSLVVDNAAYTLHKAIQRSLWILQGDLNGAMRANSYTTAAVFA